MGERVTAIRQTFLLEAVIAAPLMAGGFLLAGSRGVIGGLLLALLIEALAWLCSRPILARICSATPLCDGEHPQLVAAVGRIAEAAGLPTPRTRRRPCGCAGTPRRRCTRRRTHRRSSG